jgi:hypothetical protein
MTAPRPDETHRSELRPTDANDPATRNAWVDPELAVPPEGAEGASDPPTDDPTDPPTHHVGIDPELGPPPEGYGGKPGQTGYDAPDSERTTGEAVDPAERR